MGAFQGLMQSAASGMAPTGNPMAMPVHHKENGYDEVVAAREQAQNQLNMIRKKATVGPLTAYDRVMMRHLEHEIGGYDQAEAGALLQHQQDEMAGASDEAAARQSRAAEAAQRLKGYNKQPAPGGVGY